MSRFSELYAEFKEEIFLIKGGVAFVQYSYKGIGLLKEAKAQATIPWPSEVSSFLDCIPSPNRRAENLTHDGMVVLLAATYEVFARDTVEAICREIENSIPKFDDLDEKIKSSNARFTGRILSRHSAKRYSQFNYLDLCQKLGTCVSGSVQYYLNSGPLSAHDHNLSSTELAKLFNRVGIDKFWERIGATSPAQQYFEITEPILTRTEVVAKLDEFILLRNQVAHNGSGETSIGPEAIIQWLDFFLMLAESISVVSSKYCRDLAPIE